MTIDKNLDIAQRMKEQFGFYITALTFTVLGLATQTAEFGSSAISDVTELCSWLLLFSSGLIGLSRLELLPVAYEARFHAKGLNNELLNYQDHKAKGVKEVEDSSGKHPIDAVIENRRTLKTKAQETMEAIERSTPRKYIFQKWLFVAGMSLVIVSRAFLPIKTLLISACTNT